MKTDNHTTIGLDLGDHRHHVRVLSASGEVIAEESIPNTHAVLTALAGEFERQRIELPIPTEAVVRVQTECLST